MSKYTRTCKPILRIPEPPSPDIKPFKGEPGHKVRKTAHEKNEEYKQHIRDNEGHTFHQIYISVMTKVVMVPPPMVLRVSS